MNAVKTTFSIKDLESLGGVKAHTIRIWEKRYNLLEPQRTPTNIRTYTLADLQKLLNVRFLLDNNYKISKVAKHDSKAIAAMVADLVARKNAEITSHAINSLKIAMMNFDQELFQATYDALREDLSFQEVFIQAFIPLLHEIGLLWQTDTINPAHEHFIYNLIKQKIVLQTEKVQQQVGTQKKTTFVLFLPENEIHELGLIYLNYELIAKGYKTIYLGQSIQLESLEYLSLNHPEIAFVSYFTVKPEPDELPEYLETFNTTFKKFTHQLHVLGYRVQELNATKTPKNVQVHKKIEDFIQTL
ncbi:MerR family transcriptional regulator [Croceiramulus getboli]|nr:MerR family transcriptional regulator [Flavobacteriaceae bacterium YJPT1-3]